MAYFTMSVIMEFSEYENIEIFNKTQSFGEINMSDSNLQELKNLLCSLLILYSIVIFYCRWLQPTVPEASLNVGFSPNFLYKLG